MKNMITNTASLCQLRMLTMAAVSFMTCTTTQASVERHGDLEIYKKPQASAPVITLMLDVSGSMNVIDEPSSGCSYNGDSPYEENTYGYTTYYCKSGNNKYYRRIDNLKMGVSDLVNSPELKNKVNLGIGTYPLSTANSSKAEISGNGHIDIPANMLDDTHANNINNFIKNLQPTWNTPIAQAYGEAGSYMMGTRTNKKTQTPYYLYKETYQLDKGFRGFGFGIFRESDKKCIEWNSINKSQVSINNNLITCKRWENVSRLNISTIENQGNQFDRTIIDMRGFWRLKVRYEIDIYTTVVTEDDPIVRNGNIVPYPLLDSALVENKYSGFKYSAADTKNSNTNYKSPLPNSNASCAGNAIYFLTDGYPNQSSTTIAKSVMNNALEPLTGTQKLTVECSGTSEKAWPCILDYSQKLLDTNNPKGIEIKTATVGFGPAFNSIRSATTEAECEAGANEDVKNLCKWGIRGKGGFYYADDSQGIVNSIKSLTGKLTEDIPPVSTGSMAVPLDDLNVSTSRKFAYLPLLDPQPLAPYKLWKGNLKKYNVKNGTLVDQSNKAVFTNKDGVFASNTADVYNTLQDTSRSDVRRPDKALPQVGGTYQHIFENSNSRKLYVNQNGSLKSISADGITANAKPLGFNALTSYLKPQKAQLLNFLGYPVAADFTVDDSKKIGVAFDPTKKQLGGVLHSLPQLISKKAELKADGTIDNTKREDYVLYGSFDGALHVVRDDDSDKAGEEIFTFIPKHVLDQQGESFVNPDRVANNPIFGVDGPWSVFTNYKYSSDRVEAQQSLAFGGLRMGGSMYYGLNLSNLTDPKMIYSVGSTYAIDGSSNAKGSKNDTVADTTTNTNEQKAYAKMGLSFAKPSVGYVMKDGKRVMVNFLAGGYDRCYEDPKFKLGSAITTNTIAGCNGKTTAQGNGIYMVQVGEEKVDKKTDSSPEATNESSFDTTIGNGDLLWWTSSSNNGAGNSKFTQASDMKHSVVTEIRALDRNYDGLTDQLVFADLGGQVWRVDINNSIESSTFKVDRVTKMLDLSVAGTNSALGNGDALPRIYEKPLVTFTRLGEGTDIVGLVTVGTGDRSSPVTAQRNVADRIYTFVDRDIARPDLFCYDVQATTENECENVTLTLKQSTAVNPTNLVELTTNNSGEFTNTSAIKTQMDAYEKLGWYMPLTMWSETNTNGTQAISTNNKGIKMFNQPDAVAGLLFTTVYNPSVGDTSGTCSAGVTGRTQREQLCLPYGVCLSKDVDSDGALTGGWVVRKTRYVSNAGIGIVDNIIADGNFEGDTKNSVVVLENSCTGTECAKVILTPNPITQELNCQGTSCQVVTDSRIDPMQWKER
ncbi:MAG: PilC/PilY family type IV pilus protein [Psychrobacter pacificensis]|uniref:PilC/PilY family type IV pilus protein n=1 Tax=Psychrobacter pacificensis TaxID=112002 RepID=UPI002390F6A4|nr:PilC/PilY family type IV pilus protein [Psychrobacter pacificensis]MDE0843220.1 PilC/PilY family type IV pilus protein [Psychrobacter pacificensis]